MVDTRFVFLELGSLNMWAPLVFFTPNPSRTIIGLPTISLLLWPIAWQGKAGESNPMTTRENAANRQPTLSSTPHVSRTNAIAHHKALQCTYAFLIGCGGILIKINFGWRTLLMMSLYIAENAVGDLKSGQASMTDNWTLFLTESLNFSLWKESKRISVLRHWNFAKTKNWESMLYKLSRTFIKLTQSQPSKPSVCHQLAQLVLPKITIWNCDARLRFAKDANGNGKWAKFKATDYLQE